jgi:flagellar biosynthesis protein
MSNPPNKTLAVALSYDKSKDAAPRVVATGRGWLGQKIIDVAREHGVPLEQNPELAEALSVLELDEEIPDRLYHVVAQILGFVLRASGHLR